MGKYTPENYTQEQYEKDFLLVRNVDNLSINFYDPKSDLEEKKYILSDVLGYHGLRVGSNKSEVRFVKLADCYFGRINSVLKERYYSALNRLGAFGNPADRKKKKQEFGGRIDVRTGQISLDLSW